MYLHMQTIFINLSIRKYIRYILTLCFMLCSGYILSTPGSTTTIVVGSDSEDVLCI